MRIFFVRSLAVVFLLLIFSRVSRAEATLVTNGKARCWIQVEAAVMEADRKLPRDATYPQREAETQRQRLRESVLDLTQYLEKISGAKFDILNQPAAGRDDLPILIGKLAEQKFGPLKQKTPYKQGWRVVIAADAIGLMGESDEATSYAIYEMLDRLGCRWFMPGELGEVLPHSPTITLPASDTSGAPSTAYRGIWYGDEAFKRRNRLGGFNISAGHALEGYITKQQREEHPEWRAVIGGKPHATLLKWSNPEVANAIADAIIARLDKNYTPSISLSPDDGAEFDESDDKALDAGDFDPAMGQVSITDRYIVLCNRIAERVVKKYPDVRFGFLAYVQYTRPPVREKLHPSLVPQIAPISYCRAHAMTDKDVCPSRPQILPILQGWGKASPQVSYYNYLYHLAEVTVPYPMMHQMSEELPLIYANNVIFWQPETTSNFESVLPGMWLSLRMAWNKNQQPTQILDDLFTRLYGNAAAPMRRYWQTFDDAWTTVPEHAGSSWGYLRRFTPEVLTKARAAMDEALQVAATPMELRRVKMQDDSLRQFERFMQLRRDLAEGRLTNLDLRSTQWLGTQLSLADEYEASSAFTKVKWTPRTMGGTYYKSFFEATYLDAARIARENVLIPGPLRQWKYQKDEKQEGEAQGWQSETYADTTWKTTDSALDTWFDLGLEGYYGALWYRQSVKVPAIPAGKKVYVWLAATDGSAKVFVNGKPATYTNLKGEVKDEADGFAQPFSFDITGAIKPNTTNLITIKATRTFLNELGTGGLMGPVYLYREK